MRVGLGALDRQRVAGLGVVGPGGERVVVGVPGQLGDLALGVGDVGGPAEPVDQVGGAVVLRIGDDRLDLRSGLSVRVGVGELGGAVEPVGVGLGRPFELRVVFGPGVVVQVGGVPARVGDADELDVLVALGHVVAEREHLRLGRAGAVDQFAEQSLVGVGEGELPRIGGADGDVGDLLDVIDDLRVGQVRLSGDLGPGGVVDV